MNLNQPYYIEPRKGKNHIDLEGKWEFVWTDKAIEKTLERKANVLFPKDNCRFASYLLRHFHEYLGEVKGEDIDVIHWNAGLWDTLRQFDEDPHIPIDVYSYYKKNVECC